MREYIQRLQIFLAKRFGAYRYDGLMDLAAGYPKARVLYPDGKTSVAMPLGNAVEYAEMFGGEVVREQNQK